jgi:predicted GNAT family acetyltransferase
MVEVVDNPNKSRYEVKVDGRVAGFTRYRQTGTGVIDFFHTEVDPEFEGRGLGSLLAAGALDDVRAKGGRVMASCPFISVYLKRHTEYADLFAAG